MIARAHEIRIASIAAALATLLLFAAASSGHAYIIRTVKMNTPRLPYTTPVEGLGYTEKQAITNYMHDLASAKRGCLESGGSYFSPLGNPPPPFPINEGFWILAAPWKCI